MTESNLRLASDYCIEVRWRGIRNEDTYITFVDRIVRFLEPRASSLDDVSSADVAALVRHFASEGNSGSTIKLKLSVLRVIFKEALKSDPPLASKRMPEIEVRRPRTPKWWLRPEAQQKVTEWLRSGAACEVYHAELMADYIDFVCASGVRVEEALRLTPAMFTGLDGPEPEFTVPGTKTAGSQVTLPLYPRAAEIAHKRIAVDPKGRLFPVQYPTLSKEWMQVRAFLGEGNNRTCTLKALRRSFGRVATENGMPTELLRAYYRHSNLSTTAGYLNLVGGYDTESFRRWLPNETPSDAAMIPAG